MELKTRLYTIEDECASLIEEVSEYIYEHAELGNEEYKSSA